MHGHLHRKQELLQQHNSIHNKEHIDPRDIFLYH